MTTSLAELLSGAWLGVQAVTKSARATATSLRNFIGSGSRRRQWGHDSARSGPYAGSNRACNGKARDAANGASGNGFLGPSTARDGGRQSHDKERPHHSHFPRREKYPGQFLTTGESPAKSPLTAKSANDPSPAITTGDRPLAQGPVREVRSALQLQIIAPSWRLSHSGPDSQLSDFCISRQSYAPMQAHLRSPSGVSKQLNVAQAFERARNNAATMLSMRRADRISPSIFHGGILTLDTCPRYQNSARWRRS